MLAIVQRSAEGLEALVASLLGNDRTLNIGEYCASSQGQTARHGLPRDMWPSAHVGSEQRMPWVSSPPDMHIHLTRLEVSKVPNLQDGGDGG